MGRRCSNGRLGKPIGETNNSGEEQHARTTTRLGQLRPQLSTIGEQASAACSTHLKRPLLL
eukprot:4726220-Amphidinium_carterae.1